jgi:aspartyl-tRNA(Asn)/glutamyl-tRNA(Gln) amidotransferase subunit C
MSAVDTAGIDAAGPRHLKPSVSIALRLREDVVSETENRDANQRSAPSVEAGLFLVPKVIE